MTSKPTWFSVLNTAARVVPGAEARSSCPQSRSMRARDRWHAPGSAASDRPCPGQPTGNRPAQQQMIDAQSCIPRKRVPEIFPEGVDPLVRMERAQRVGPTLAGEATKGLAHLRSKQRVIHPALRRVHVEIDRH